MKTKRAIRLLFVHERWGALGGAEANVLLTARELQRRGHVVGLAHGDPTGREEALWQETFSEHFFLEPADRAAALQTVLTQFQPTAVFMHKMPDLAVVEALSLCGVPVVRMVHDHDLYCMRSYKYNTLTRTICSRAASPFCVFPCGATLARGEAGAHWPFRWVSYAEKRRELDLNRRFRRLIVATGFMKNELLRNGFAAEQIEIHAPVPQAADENCQSSFSDRNLIVYAGQIIRGKGVDVLLESLARVPSRFECVILGDGSHRAHCERLSRQLGLADRVRFLGFVPQMEVLNYYREASLAVMSSVWPEPFGAVGLEAMRCGLPVVAFDAGGISEWLIDGWNGYLVPWMDRGRYAARVEELLCDKALARMMGINGREWADERFNFENYIDGLEDMFLQVALSPPVSSPA